MLFLHQPLELVEMSKLNNPLQSLALKLNKLKKPKTMKFQSEPVVGLAFSAF